MATALKNLSEYEAFELKNAAKYRIGIVTAEWNEHITSALEQGALEVLRQQGIEAKNVKAVSVPGSYELPLAAQWLHKEFKADAVIAIGCLIKGETPHFEYISDSVAHGLMELNLKHNIPFAFGVITVLTEQQALDRAGGIHGNKGTEAAVTVLRMLQLKEGL
ncbi:MAG: 6,7-dimethyl-8-ribityllumazine synthase [Sphingobacteriaceae bacterium]|nr:6,7-dimethyl-8-ribityllumazine synthase [Sphingobacteriaceae bacterium]